MMYIRKAADKMRIARLGYTVTGDMLHKYEAINLYRKREDS